MLDFSLLSLHVLLQILTLPFSYLMYRIWMAGLRQRKAVPALAGNCLTRFVVLVPAHNEELSIQATVQSLLAMQYPLELFEILVIADNCNDATAERARLAGAKVLERFHETQKSKGFALEFAIKYLTERGRPPDAIVIIDADTQVDPHLLLAFDHRLRRGQDWIQAYYTVSNPLDSWRTRLMTFAFAHFNGVWLLGQDALAYGCALRGNGMAFSWRGLLRCPWQAYGLTEDLEFGWRLRLAGEKVCFAPEVRVYGEMIDRHPAGAAAQRLRWEHGRRQLRRMFSRQIWENSWGWSKKALAFSDLYMPALAAYFARLLAVLGTACGLVFLAKGTLLSEILLGLSLIQLLNFIIYLYMPFILVGLPASYLKLFAFGPIYVLWKASLLVRRAPAAWIRTVRKPKV